MAGFVDSSEAERSSIRSKNVAPTHNTWLLKLSDVERLTNDWTLTFQLWGGPDQNITGDILYSMTDMKLIAAADCLSGDVNGDGSVDLLDVGPFVELLISGDFACEADIDGNGTVDLLDVTPFVDVLAGG